MVAVDDRLNADLLRIFFRSRNRRLWTSNVLIPAVVIAAAYDVVPWQWSAAWALLHAGVFILRWTLHGAYERAEPPPSAAARWMWYGGLSVLASAAIWGLASLGFLLPEASHILHWLLGLALLGLVSGAAVSTAAILPAFYGYVALAVGPYLIGIAAQSDPAAYASGAIVLALTATKFIVARNYRRTLEQMIRLRYDNLDLIEAMRAEKQEADVARERAEEANLAKSKYLAAASHDLRQPVHALGLFVEELRQEAVANGYSTALVENIGAAVESLDSLLGSVLDISKLDSGMVKPRIASFRIDGLLQRVVAQHEGAAREKGLAMRYVACSATVRSDPALLLRIVGNFVSNAVRYTARGRILIGCRRLHDALRIEVWDTGQGIPAAEHENVFREFHRLDDSRDGGSGLGLGLAIAQRTARLLGHRLGMHSAPGRGSVFRIDAPYGDVAEERRTAGTRLDQVDLTGLVVAIVDDERAIVVAMSGLLRRWGCDVVAAHSGDELLIALNRRAVVPDVMLVDYQLADGEVGTETIARARSLLKTNVPSLVITGDLLREHQSAFDAAGLGILHKPVRPDRLRQCLAELPRQRQRNRHSA